LDLFIKHLEVVPFEAGYNPVERISDGHTDQHHIDVYMKRYDLDIWLANRDLRRFGNSGGLLRGLVIGRPEGNWKSEYGAYGKAQEAETASLAH
jgi:hypothetical protein